MIDIHSKGTYPSNALSNFAAYDFMIDNVECYSMEGFLQSLKYRNCKRQRAVCRLSGKDAKQSAGRLRNFRWKLTQRLYWQGKAYRRDSEEYQRLITYAYDALSENHAFQDALCASGNEALCHSIGGRDMRKTVLTEQEFIGQLYRLRGTR